MLNHIQLIKFNRRRLRELIIKYAELTKIDTILFTGINITENNINSFLDYVETGEKKDIFMDTVEEYIQELKTIISGNNPTEYGFGIPLNTEDH